MRTIVLFCMLLSLSTSITAQVNGKVIDNNEHPIPFANAILYHYPNKALVQGVITDDNGNFQFEKVTNGTYTLVISLLSYKTYTSEPFTIENKTTGKMFPSIRLIEEAVALNEVTIKAKRKLIEHTPEGSVLNVQESILTKGSSALQLLERAPGVILDQRNNNFSLNGKTGTTIMINNKVMRIPTNDLIAILNGMSADNIQKIELLTNPSARYDSDGNGGIINIVMLKNESLGTKGNYSLTGGYGVGAKQTTSLSLNYGGNRINTYGTYSFSYDDTYYEWVAKGTTEISSLGGTTDIIFSSKSAQLQRSHNSTVGLEYTINDSTLVGVSFLLNYARPKITTNNRGLYDFEIDPFLDARIQLLGNSNWNNLNSSLYYEINKKRNTFTITADFIKYNNKRPNTVNSFYFDVNGQPVEPGGEIYNTGNIGINETDINIGVLKADYKHLFNDKFSIEAGVKGSLSKTNNEAQIKILRGGDFVTENRFLSDRTIDESIASTYTLADYKINKTLSAQLGLRFEYWNQVFDDNTLDRDFGKFFPSFFLKNTFTDVKSLNLAYTKRITRPNYTDLASFLSYNGPTSVFSGNPELLPTISNTINLSYIYKSYSFSLIASKDKNPIAGYQITRRPLSDLAVIAPVNLAYQNSFDFQTNIPVKIANWWSLNFNGTAGIREFKLLHTDTQIKHNYLHFNFNGSQTIKLPSQLSLELSGWYTSKHFSGSTKLDGFGTLNGGIKKTFKNGASLQFSVTDIFESINIKSRVGTLTREAFGDVFTVDFKPESTNERIFKLTYSHSFGNKKVKNANKKSGADEEKSRVNN